MLTKLLNLLKNGESYSVEMLAEKLETKKDYILSALQYLETIGYIKRVYIESTCEKDCRHCGGCKVARGDEKTAVWEFKVETFDIL